MKLSFARGVLILSLLVAAARAQAPVPLPGPAEPSASGAIVAAPGALNPTRSRTFPHISPPPLPPIAQFDLLLRASPEDRTNQLAGKSESARGLILHALAEFDALKGVEREKRALQLRVAQLRFFLRPLLRTNPESRALILTTIPAEDRSMVSNRLAVWEQLPIPIREEVLESDDALQHFVRLASTRSGAPGPATNSFDATVPPELFQSWNRWQSLPPEERARREAIFQQFFDLTPDEQIRAIGSLPAAERRRMEHTLAKFNQLPPARRDLCVQNFDQLARLPESERKAFLRNAAKWKAMTQAERDAWRRLVMSVPPPPMPPIRPTVAGSAGALPR